MKNINLIKHVSKLFMGAMVLVFSVSLTSCDPTIDSLTYDLAEANSKVDLKPPVANFSATPTADYLTYTFSNTSSSATDYVWDYGDGNSAISVDGQNTFPGEGTFTVTLMSTDKLGKSDTFSMEIVIIEPEVPLVVAPEILGAGIELDEEKSFWEPPFKRVDGKTVVMQTTTSGGYFEGARGGKFPNSGERLGYQELNFTPNATYVLKYKYRMKNGKAETGIMNVAIVNPLTEWNLTTLSANTIAANAHAETADNVAALTEGTLIFNSGANTKLAIVLYNDVEEIYIDSFTLEALN
ncbi:MAG: PKD domain-containing protein [Lutibacter sp.]|nr:PKD domain-containing protein [Lutibacter sp.]MBP9600184.1 PKD domain-containing protein [Lutibacter sp.]